MWQERDSRPGPRTFRKIPETMEKLRKKLNKNKRKGGTKRKASKESGWEEWEDGRLGEWEDGRIVRACALNIEKGDMKKIRNEG